MAMITFSGYPSSGKSTRAKELAQFLESKLASPSCSPSTSRLKVVIINDESLGISKGSYDDSRQEKPARATLLSAVQRSLNRDTIVIVDAMNYIKGSRYQMYLTARELSCRVCTIFIAAPPQQCREWNTGRPADEAYIVPTFENLVTRFEEPSGSARWDSPLFTIPHFDPTISSVDAEAIWEAVTSAYIKPPNVATQANPTSTTSYLTLLETTTNILISTLLSTQALSPLSGPTRILLPTTPPVPVTINLNKTVSMPMCQRLKRQFTKLNMHGGAELEVEQIARLFGEYLEGAMR